MKQRCQLCGGKLSPRWNEGDPLRCQACGAGNRKLHEVEEHWARADHDNWIEERIATEGESC